MFEQAFKNIDVALRKEAGCASELDCAEQTSWLLFLKYLDGLEQDKAMEAELEGKTYTYLLDEPYRWESWAAPKDADGKLDHSKALAGDDLRDFVDRRLFPYLHGYKQKASGPNTIEYKVGQIFGEIKNKIHSGYPPDFFDFIVIDECHRGGANDESNWRCIMDYFTPAVQLGLTATPKRNDNVDTYAYFGDPVYIYSLKDGINDGYLTPFRVKQIFTTLDEYIYTSDDRVVEGEIEAGRLYALPPLTREERAAKARVLLTQHFSTKQQVFLGFVLSHYVTIGVEELDQTKLTPLLKLKYHDSISDAVADLGKPEEIGQVFAEFQQYLYQRTP